MPEPTRRLIYDLDLPDLEQAFKAAGEPVYRAKQVWQGLYQQLWNQPEQFSNLPKSLRDWLGTTFVFQNLTPDLVMLSTDQETRKTLFLLPDNRAIEAVLMHYDKRKTLCISTQAGCAMGCVFCATGQMGFKRHLTSGEIVEEVLYYARMLRVEGEQVTNVVFMGMGEPFHNYEATMSAISRLNHPDGLNLGARRFTLSTVGLVPMIKRFADEKSQVNLAISLHATNDELRSSMLPINRKYPIAELMAACREYIQKTGRRLTFEWALIQGVNDSVETARELGNLLKGMIAHVNVIPLNPTHKFTGIGSTRERAAAFKAELEKMGVPCTVRMRRGIDIQAGCGQLATRAEQNSAQTAVI
ncbi:MAG TPA: 23S rRNA (adenine(2503)-C(2))-methyltransferase RlmN [Bellilinea sp.]|nr:23S rRNA (adenine(2503)-C(2))-methyltransferase RlmN [Bellilinea sp.]